MSEPLQTYQEQLLAFWSRAKAGDKLMLHRGRLLWWPSEMDKMEPPQSPSTGLLRGLRADMVYIDEVASVEA